MVCPHGSGEDSILRKRKQCPRKGGFAFYLLSLVNNTSGLFKGVLLLGEPLSSQVSVG